MQQLNFEVALLSNVPQVFAQRVKVELILYAKM